MIVKEINTNKVIIIDNNSFDVDLHIDYDNSIYQISTNYLKLGKTKGELKSKLSSIISDRGGFASLREPEKLIIAQQFATNQANIDTVLTKEEQVELIASAYDVPLTDGSHRSSGINYFNMFRAGLVYNYRKGVYSSLDIFQIEELLKDVTSKLITGDWMSSNALLSMIEVTPLFTQEIKDKLQTDFTNYIQNHY